MTTILLIEDDDTFRGVPHEVLQSNGFAVIAATSGRHGLDQYRRARPYVVLTDVIMPDGDGIETLLAIRREHPEATIIAMSSSDSSHLDYLHLIQKLGASAVLRKPFTAEDLIATVRRCLDPEA